MARNIVDLSTDVLVRIVQVLEIREGVALKASCKLFNKLSKRVRIKDVLILQLYGKIIANTNYIRKKHIEIYNADEEMPLVLLMYVPNNKASIIEKMFSNNTCFRLRCVCSIEDTIDPETVGALNRVGGFYSCVIEYPSEPVYYHYHCEHKYNVEFFDEPHDSYIEILDILMPFIDDMKLQSYRRSPF